MPAFTVGIVLFVGLLMLNPDDWIGELKGAVAVLVPVVLYWWKVKRDDRAEKEKESHEATDSILNYSADKEKRLEERASALRQEEREFMHEQMKLSRERSHLLARGYMAVELANDRLIDLLRENKIDVPPALLTLQTRAMILGELKKIDEAVANGTFQESDPE